MSQLEEQNRKAQEVASSKEEEATKIDEIASIRGWFRPVNDSHFYPIVQKYLTANNTVEDIIGELLKPIDEKISTERPDDANFSDLWYSIIHSSRRVNFCTSDKHQMLVDLVASIKTHSVSGNEKHNSLYSSLNEFSMACREAYNDEPIPGTSADVEVLAWANLNFLYALLTSHNVADRSIYAIWALRPALETPHEDDDESTALQKYNTYVPTAAAWMLGASELLHSKEEDLTPKDRKFGNPGKGGELWKGKAEFSKERWNFWNERFAEIGKMDDVNEQTRTLARDAVQAMERAATIQKIR